MRPWEACCWPPLLRPPRLGSPPDSRRAQPGRWPAGKASPPFWVPRGTARSPAPHLPAPIRPPGLPGLRPRGKWNFCLKAEVGTEPPDRLAWPPPASHLCGEPAPPLQGGVSSPLSLPPPPAGALPPYRHPTVPHLLRFVNPNARLFKGLQRPHSPAGAAADGGGRQGAYPGAAHGQRDLEQGPLFPLRMIRTHIPLLLN